MPLTFIFNQNLVPNASFEDFLNCPPYLGQIHESVSWDSPNNNTTDYFHTCSPPSNGASIPNNSLGEQLPAQGDAYAGIRIWIPVIPGNPIYREYLSTQLEAPLQAGTQYEVRFQVSLAEASSHATDDLGIYFSKSPLDNKRFYDVVPQIQNTPDQLLDNSKDWVTISGTFVAEGGETFLTIGTFLDDQEMTRVQVAVSEEPKVYYYIDEISVLPCIQPDELLQIVDTSLCKGGSVELLGLPSAQTYRWDNLFTTINRSVSRAGDYEVLSQTLCYDFTTIFQVEEKDCTCRPSITSPQMIDPLVDGGNLSLHVNEFTQVKQLFLFDALGRLTLKSSGDELINFNAYQLAAGVYFYKIKYDCIDLVGNRIEGQQTGKFVTVW